MSLTLPRKRTRSCSDAAMDDERPEGSSVSAGGQLVQPARDEEFWYEDGNVILIAQTVEFRVFKGILADVSPVFKDMLSLPQPADAETSHGCAVVHVTDSPGDLRHILRVYMPKTEPRCVLHRVLTVRQRR